MGSVFFVIVRLKSCGVKRRLRNTKNVRKVTEKKTNAGQAKTKYHNKEKKNVAERL